MSTGSSPSASGDGAHPSRDPCVFCEIVARRAPASRVLETRDVLALIPLRPKCEGHCLVIPKRHADRMHELPDATLGDIARTLKRLAAAMDLHSYDVLQVNGPYANDPGVRPPRPPVRHVHFHLIPRKRGDGIRIMAVSSARPSREELDRMAQRLRMQLDESTASAP